MVYDLNLVCIFITTKLIFFFSRWCTSVFSHIILLIYPPNLFCPLAWFPSLVGSLQETSKGGRYLEAPVSGSARAPLTLNTFSHLTNGAGGEWALDTPVPGLSVKKPVVAGPRGTLQTLRTVTHSHTSHAHTSIDFD